MINRQQLFTCVVVAWAFAFMASSTTVSQQQPEPAGQGRGRGFQRGRNDPTFIADRDAFHFLLENHEKIRREVKNRDDGVETLTESDDPAISARIQEHVTAMHKRVDGERPIRMRDPLFRELFRHAKQIEMRVEKTDKGVRVFETSTDAYVALLIQEHAKVISAFVEKGFAEARKNHAVPKMVDAVAKKKAVDAKDELFKRLSTRLIAAMSDGGPTKAITVCSEEAANIAKEVGKEQGVAIGRTSFQLRNANNKPPKWAETLVEQRVQEPTFQELPGGKLTAFLPIRLKAQCLACHGPKEMIDESVQTILAEHYPNDQATGFKEGDLRGWFWVEVPAAPQEEEKPLENSE